MGPYALVRSGCWGHPVQREQGPCGPLGLDGVGEGESACGEKVPGN